MTTLLIAAVQLMASWFRIAEFCLLGGGGELIAYKEQECPDYEIKSESYQKKKKGKVVFI